MAGEINFGALQTPDYFGNALRAQGLGQQAAVQTQRRNALSGYSSDPTGTISQLATIDPEAAQNLSRVHQADVAATARTKASQQFAGGDSAGAQATAAFAGDNDLLTALTKMDDQGRAQAKERAGNLASVAYGLRSLPYEARKAQLSQLAPRAADLGMTPEAIQGFDPTDGNIDAVVNKSLGLKELIERHDKLSKPVEMDPTKNYFLPDEAGAPPAPAGQGGQGGQGGGVAPASTPAAPSGGNIDAVWSAVKQQESGGDGNAVGPQTPYGQAQGSTQMLMPTAEGMARKLGVAWNPSLMRGDTPRALAYQDMLGKAYFQEGLDKYGGDVTKALAYYHGGPNEQLWGPKTQAYVGDVLGRIQGGAGGDTLQGGAQPYEVAANGGTPPPPTGGNLPGFHQIQQGQAKPTRQARPATAEEKASYGIAADVPAQIKPDGSIDVISGTGANLKRVPPAVQGGYVQNNQAMTQIDDAIAMLRKHPHALGIKNYAGDDINQRLDPDGIDTRAAVTNIGSKVLHDRSGAAVTAAESPRLMPFIPQPTDTAVAAIKKLNGLKQQYLSANTEIEVAYGPDSGYAALGGGGRAHAAAAGGQAQGGALPPQAAAQLKAGHTTTFANGQKWTLRNGQPERLR